MRASRTRRKNDGISSISEALPKPAEFKLRLSVDNGTSTLAMAYEVVPLHNTSTHPPIIQDVRFDGDTCEATMIATYFKNRFIWGPEVEQLIGQGILSEGDAIRSWKLALYPDAHNATFADDLENRLRSQFGKTLKDLFRDSIQHFVVYAIDYIAERLPAGFTHDVKSIPLELIINVPALWSHRAIRIMTVAVQEAGLTCEIVHEPRSVAAYLLTQEVKLTKDGIAVLVEDLGGGTGDFVAYEPSGDLSDVEHIKLKTAAPPQGHLCGSELVNRAFLAWLQTTWTDQNQRKIKDVAQALNCTVPDFLATASVAFESEKLRLKKYLDEDVAATSINKKKRKAPSLQASEHVFRILVSAKQPSMNYELIRVTKTEMKSFFEGPVRDIISRTDEQIEKCPNIKMILLSGGFGKSDYVYGRLRARYENMLPPIQVRQAPDLNGRLVSRGALLRNRLPTTRDLVTGQSFGIPIVETFDKKRHPDAWTANKYGVYEPDVDLVKYDPIDKDHDIVEDRMKWIVSHDVKLIDGFVSAEDFTEQYINVQQGALEISRTIYYSTSPNIRNHEPLYARDGKIHAHILEWDKVTIMIPNPSKRKWKIVEDLEGVDSWKFYCALVFRKNGATFDVGMKILEGNEGPSKGSGFKRKGQKHTIIWEQDHYKQIWSASANNIAAEQD